MCVSDGRRRGLFVSRRGDVGRRWVPSRGEALQGGLEGLVGERPRPPAPDPRAGFGIYDATSQVVEIYRTPYPVERTQAKIREAGLPAALAQRPAIGP